MQVQQETSHTVQNSDREPLGQVRESMESDGVDVLIVAPSADLQYLIQVGSHPSERPTLLTVTAEGALLVLPEFEAPLAAHVSNVRIVTYGETDDPYALLTANIQVPNRPLQIAVSERMWSSFLLRLQAAYPQATFRSAAPLLARLRQIKSPREIELMARAGSMADAAFEQIVKTQFSGRTEREVAADLLRFLAENGLDTADWDPIVGSGPNSASPHHLTGDREIRVGDPVVMDFGGSLEGYKADMTRTVHVGPPSEEFNRIYETVKRAQDAGVHAVRPGVQAQSVDQVTRSVIEDAGYGEYFLHRTGHGLGLDIHEDPYIVSGNESPLEVGTVFSIEPGIYVKGRHGVRIEDIVALTDGGARRLNNADHELVVVQ